MRPGCDDKVVKRSFGLFGGISLLLLLFPFTTAYGGTDKLGIGSTEREAHLGGNAAEYAYGAELYGFGAYDFVDAAGEGLRSDQPAGFRAVME